MSLAAKAWTISDINSMIMDGRLNIKKKFKAKLQSSTETHFIYPLRNKMGTTQRSKKEI
jgi:hypothetical protein